MTKFILNSPSRLLFYLQQLSNNDIFQIQVSSYFNHSNSLVSIKAQISNLHDNDTE